MSNLKALKPECLKISSGYNWGCYKKAANRRAFKTLGSRYYRRVVNKNMVAESLED